MYETFIERTHEAQIVVEITVRYVIICYRTTLARWRAAQINEQGYQEKERRPFLATECTDLNKAEKWRTEIIREIARKVSQIQNGNIKFRVI